MSSASVIATFTVSVLVALTPAAIASSSNHLDGAASFKVQSFQSSSAGNLVKLQKYGGSDPHGDDPHGDDPREEQHDGKLPANKDRDQGKAPKDVYGDKYPNSQAPY